MATRFGWPFLILVILSLALTGCGGGTSASNSGGGSGGGTGGSGGGTGGQGNAACDVMSKGQNANLNGLSNPTRGYFSRRCTATAGEENSIYTPS